MGYLLSTYRNDTKGHTFIGEGAKIFLNHIGTAFPIKIPAGETIRIFQVIEAMNTGTIGNLKSRFHEWVLRGKGPEF